MLAFTRTGFNLVYSDAGSLFGFQDLDLVFFGQLAFCFFKDLDKVWFSSDYWNGSFFWIFVIDLMYQSTSALKVNGFNKLNNSKSTSIGKFSYSWLIAHLYHIKLICSIFILFFSYLRCAYKKQVFHYKIKERLFDSYQHKAFFFHSSLLRLFLNDQHE